MQRKKIESLPLYPEGRPSRRPTTRRVIDLFAAIQRHELTYPKWRPRTLRTELTPIQCEILHLLELAPVNYGH